MQNAYWYGVLYEFPSTSVMLNTTPATKCRRRISYLNDDARASVLRKHLCVEFV